MHLTESVSDVKSYNDGRAAIIKIEAASEFVQIPSEFVQILNIYAPREHNKKIIFFKDLKEEKERMEIRNNSLKSQIEKMNVDLAEMQAKLEPVLQDIQGKNDKPSK